MPCRHSYEVANAADYAERRDGIGKEGCIGKVTGKSSRGGGDYCRLLDGNVKDEDELIDEDKVLREL